MHIEQPNHSSHLLVILSVALGVIIGIGAAMLAIASMGAGHGDYLYAKLLFPFTMLFAEMIGRLPLAAAVGSLLQFPLYGWIIGRNKSLRSAAASAFLILLIHVVAVAVLFLLTEP